MSSNIKLTVNGTDLTKYIEAGSNPYSITKQFSRQGDTATFVLYDDHPVYNVYSYTIGICSSIVFEDMTTGVVLFSGICNKPQFTVKGPNLAVWTLNCVDYSTLADNAKVVGDQVNITCGQAICNLVKAANCGLSASLVSEGGFVAAGPTISFLRVNYEQLSAALKDICTVASQQSGVSYGWRVDNNLQVHFQSSLQNIASGVTLTNWVGEIPNLSNTLGFFDFDNYLYSWDATQLHTQITVIGGNVKGTRVDSWRADGAQTQYLLSFPIDTSVNSATLLVGGVATTCTVVSTGVPPATGWYVVAAMNGQWSLQSTGALTRGTSVSVTYQFTAPVIATVSEYSAVLAYSNLPNQGVFAFVITDSTLQNLPAAQAAANAQLTEFAFAQETVQLQTSPAWGGHIEIGQTFFLYDVLTPDLQNPPNVGIYAPMIVTQMTINGGVNGLRTYSITAARIG